MIENPAPRDSATSAAVKFRRSFCGRLEAFVHSNHFEALTFVTIILCSVKMAVEQQYVGLDIGHDIRPETHTRPASEVWPGASKAFLYLEFIFQAAFVIELLLRLVVYRHQAIFMGWVWLDGIVVVLGMVDLIATEGIGIDPILVRLVRLVRLIRLLRLFKAMSAFDSLFLLLKAIHASASALGWSLVILVSAMTGIALLMSQMLHPFMDDKHQDISNRDKAFEYFGTFTRGMLTMFEITMANWVPVCRFLVEEVHEGFFIFFLVYRCMFCFAVLKVIAAVFISETNRVLTNDSELTIMRAHRELKAFKEKISKILRAIDKDGDGTISWGETQKFLSDYDLAAWLTTIGMDKEDFEKLFWLTEVDDQVEIDRFLNMVGNLRGQAKTVDLLNLYKLVHKLDEKFLHVYPSAGMDTQQQHLVALAEGMSSPNSTSPQR